MKRDVVLAVVVSYAALGCERKCEPALSVVEPNNGEGGAAALEVAREGQVVMIRHELPVDNLDEPIEFRVETPCACIRFSRSAVAVEQPHGGASEGGSSHCGAERLTEVAIVAPRGADCALTVTATIADDTRSVSLRGDTAACAELGCTSDVTCTESSTDGAGGGDGPGGAETGGGGGGT